MAWQNGVTPEAVTGPDRWRVEVQPETWKSAAKPGRPVTKVEPEGTREHGGASGEDGYKGVWRLRGGTGSSKRLLGAG